MHAIKGGWVGQTFALAKGNDSGGKKSRIRRSKEDRKALVESFIKKYQKLNSGSFPSLNLTHKEVGGSFYTVREIVREVIQENKVLGPAIFTQEQQSPDDTLVQYPLGSISDESKTESLSTNGFAATHIVPLCLGDGIYLNGPRDVLQKNEEHERAMDVVSWDREISVLKERTEDAEASSAKSTHLEANLTARTSPSTPGSGIMYGLNGKYNGANGNFGEKRGESSVVVEMNFLESASALNEQNDASSVGPQMKKSYDLADEKLLGKVEVPFEENSDNSTAKEGNDILLNRHQDLSEERLLSAKTRGLGPERQSFEKNEEDLGGMSIVSAEEVIAEVEGNLEDLEKYENKVTHIAADTAEAFPLSSVSRRTYGLNENSCDENVGNELLGEKGESSVVDHISFQQSDTDLTNAQTIANTVQQLENCSNVVIEKHASKVEVPLEEIVDVYTVKEGTVLDIGESIDTEIKDASLVRAKIIHTVESSNAQSPKDVKISSSQQTIQERAIANEKDPNMQLDGDIKETNPTLDRMNIESWQTYDRSQKPTNPLLVYFKALVTAFVKFWTE